MTTGRERFYAAGLRFRCQQCHNCCRGAQDGFVYLSERESRRIARWLELTEEAFRERFEREDPDGDRVLSQRRNGDCIFWDRGCTIYPVRPRQCRTYPFWPENLESAQAWSEVQKTCQGAGVGRLYRLEEIQSVLRGRPTSAD